MSTVQSEKDNQNRQQRITLKNLLQSPIVAFGMYSRLPVPHIEWSEQNMRYCMCFFPLIGAVCGAAVWIAFVLLELVRAGDLLRAALFTVIPVAVTGGIHVDGLLDTADALASHAPMERKLEILKDSHVGAFALITGICYFLLMYGAFTQIAAEDLLLVGLGYVLSRAYSGLAVVAFKKARNSGLMRTFADAAYARKVRRTMLVYIVAVSALMIVAAPMRGALTAVLAAVVFAWYRYISYRQFGGVTGDLAGFFLQICELVMIWGIALT